MAEEKQPPGVVEGATTGDVEDEMLDDKAKSAEDRKAAAALSKLDARGDDDDKAAGSAVDQEGLSKAMNKLGVSKQATTAQQKKAVKVDKADVQLLVSFGCFGWFLVVVFFSFFAPFPHSVVLSTCVYVVEYALLEKDFTRVVDGRLTLVPSIPSPGGRARLDGTQSYRIA